MCTHFSTFQHISPKQAYFNLPQLMTEHHLTRRFSRSQAICVTDISPNLKSCELLRDGTSTFQCKADVFLSLDSLDCLAA